MDKELEERILCMYAKSDGWVDIKDARKIKEFFSLKCNFCGNENIKILTEAGDDGYCETCSSPYAMATIKCMKCGAAISIKK